MNHYWTGFAVGFLCAWAGIAAGFYLGCRRNNQRMKRALELMEQQVERYQREHDAMFPPTTAP